MLILTRHPGESVVLPDLDVQIVVVRVDGDRVRLGITAPHSLRVFRDEVWQAIERTVPESSRLPEPKEPTP